MYECNGNARRNYYTFFAKPIPTQILSFWVFWVFRTGRSCYVYRINTNVNVPFIKLIFDFYPWNAIRLCSRLFYDIDTPESPWGKYNSVYQRFPIAFPWPTMRSCFPYLSQHTYFTQFSFLVSVGIEKLKNEKSQLIVMFYMAGEKITYIISLYESGEIK